MRSQDLKHGSVSTGARRTWTVLLIAVAVGLRLLTHLENGRPVPSPGASLSDFLFSSDWPWVEPPLPTLIISLGRLFNDPVKALLVLELVAVVTVIVLLLRLGERWLDFRAGLLGAALWSVCAPALAVFRVPGAEGWQAALSILVAASMLRVSSRRAVEQAWQIGALSGVLTLFSGGGGLWALAAMAWLPTTSYRFRGFGWYQIFGRILLGWLLVVSPVILRNAIVGGGDPKFPVAGELSFFHAAISQGTVAVEVSAVEGRPATAAYADSVLTDHGLDPTAPEWSRGSNMLSLALQEGGREGGKGWRSVGRRFWATAGGWSNHPAVRGLPWAAVSALAWVGIAALLPGMRFLFPLLLGGMIPLIRGALLGVNEGTALIATPFVCLYAGYGIWRIWTGRKWVLTWVVVPIVLALSLGTYLSVRSWS